MIPPYIHLIYPEQSCCFLPRGELAGVGQALWDQTRNSHHTKHRRQCPFHCTYIMRPRPDPRGTCDQIPGLQRRLQKFLFGGLGGPWSPFFNPLHPLEGASNGCGCHYRTSMCSLGHTFGVLYHLFPPFPTSCTFQELLLLPWCCLLGCQCVGSPALCVAPKNQLALKLKVFDSVPVH